MDGTRDLHRLVEINDISELTTLRDMYKKDWPENYITYYSLDNCIRLSAAGAEAVLAKSSTSPSDGNDNSSASENQQQQRHFAVYSVDGDFSDGTFILFVCDFLFFSFYILFLVLCDVMLLLLGCRLNPFFSYLIARVVFLCDLFYIDFEFLTDIHRKSK